MLTIKTKAVFLREMWLKRDTFSMKTESNQSLKFTLAKSKIKTAKVQC